MKRSKDSPFHTKSLQDRLLLYCGLVFGVFVLTIGIGGLFFPWNFSDDSGWGIPICILFGSGFIGYGWFIKDADFENEIEADRNIRTASWEEQRVYWQKEKIGMLIRVPIMCAVLWAIGWYLGRIQQSFLFNGYFIWLLLRRAWHASIELSKIHRSLSNQ